MKKRNGIRIGFLHKKHFLDDDMQHEIREMFIGHHTVFSVMGVIVGGSLVAKTLWHWMVSVWGSEITFVIGFVLFVVSGLWLHSFDEYKSDVNRAKQEEEIEESVE